ncbi:hypothetical protein PIB30_068559 [Stylosanthes scabra]|uniref:Uncharacterized protein n=1 Tax=Stylosanthes scabra TaxID=79078 RepID=A0ABU6TNH0_9FABA|nr:hypothetical protein [Stylosanthes scabra]
MPKIFGIRVKKLEHLGKNEARDLKSIPMPLSFDFHLNLPKRGLLPFIFESELFFAGCSFDSSPLSSNKVYQLSYAGGASLDIADVEETGIIPEAPTLLYNCYVANIHGHVHLLVHDAATEDRKLGFWVLRSGSGSKQWHLLPLPPTLSNYGVDPDKDTEWTSVRYRPWHSFIWKDKLFLMAQVDPDDPYIFYVYDPQNHPKDDPWEQIEHGFNPGYDTDIVAVSSRSIWLFPSPVNVNIIDLGKGKVLYKTRNKDSYQRFLSVDVLVNQVYMLPHIEDNRSEVPQNSFVFSLSKRMPLKQSYSQDSNYPRKEPKLATVTNPSTPRALLE